MDAKEIFNELISNRLRPILLCYEPYQDEYKTYPYYHIADESFEKDFSTLLFDSIVFYAYEKNEIEHEYKKGRLKDLHKAARTAYENRVQKTEKKFDGLMGELALDAFLKCFFSNIELLYSRVKYCERIPRKEAEIKRKGHEIKGYDGMVFSCENGQKCIWVGQVKTGDWKYCFEGIKEDINKSIIDYYFTDAMIILADIMRSASDVSAPLEKILDDINDILLSYPTDRKLKKENILKYCQEENILIRIPCLIIATEEDYDAENLLKKIKEHCSGAFKEYCLENEAGLNIEVLLMIFPVRDLDKLRTIFLEERIPE